MKRTHAALLLLITTMACLTAAAFPEEGDAKPARTSIRAEDGLRIVCETRGKGDTALIFLHGWCGNKEYWKHQVDAFAADYRVIAIDQAGHGDSGKDRERWTVNGLAEDVQTVVNALNLKRVILVGHSMGGPVSLVAARLMPGKVLAVIGVDTLQNAELKMRADLVRDLLTRFETNFAGTVSGMFQALVPEPTDPELVEWLASKAQAQNQAMALALMRDLSALDTAALLKGAQVPVRCINSAGGYQFFVMTAVDTNKKYGDYEAVFIEAVGHYPMLEKPQEFNARLRDVLKEFAREK